MVTFGFFLVALAHTGLILIGTPLFLLGDLFVGLQGAFNHDSKRSVAEYMNCPYHWEQVGKSWQKVWSDD